MMNLDRIHKTSGVGRATTRINGNTAFVAWMPGDGTRYVFVFTRIGSVMELEGFGSDPVLGAIVYGGQSIIFQAKSGILSYDYAEEKMPGLRGSSTLMAFVAVANWLYGSSEYADEVYAGMADKFDFENRLLKAEG